MNTSNCYWCIPNNNTTNYNKQYITLKTIDPVTAYYKKKEIINYYDNIIQEYMFSKYRRIIKEDINENSSFNIELDDIHLIYDTNLIFIIEKDHIPDFEKLGVDPYLMEFINNNDFNYSCNIHKLYTSFYINKNSKIDKTIKINIKDLMFELSDNNNKSLYNYIYNDFKDFINYKLYEYQKLWDYINDNLLIKLYDLFKEDCKIFLQYDLK